MDHGRRAFLFARKPATGEAATTPPLRPAPFRPPWARGEAEFLSLCTRCAACRDACPTGLLQAGHDGLPVADFHAGHCTFCGDCRTACPTGALDPAAEQPWRLAAAIGEDCLARQGVVCRTCGERCEAGAIRFSLRPGGVALPLLDTAACTGCGECVADCPTHAIVILHSATFPDSNLINEKRS